MTRSTIGGGVEARREQCSSRRATTKRRGSLASCGRVDIVGTERGGDDAVREVQIFSGRRLARRMSFLVFWLGVQFVNSIELFWGVVEWDTLGITLERY